MASSTLRVLSHESERTSWELVLGTPDPRLGSFVAGYEGYVESAAAGAVRRQHLPSMLIPLIVNFGTPWRISGSSDPPGEGELRDSFVAGLYESSAFVHATGRASCIQVDLTPMGAHAFLGLPMHELSNLVVDLDDVLPAGAHGLRDRLSDEPTWEARFSLLDDLFVARLAESKPPTPEIVWAWQALVRSSGDVRIGAIADRLGRSRRHLIARFREQIGLPPKTVARILRFRRAVAGLQRDRAVGLADLAHECGYFDQAHLNRDFRAFAGMTPRELARQLSPGGELLAP
jgi:AraC-like DNA-binding protein